MCVELVSSNNHRKKKSSLFSSIYIKEINEIDRIKIRNK